MAIKSFIGGNTVRLEAQFQNFPGALTDPSEVLVSVWNEVGVLVVDDEDITATGKVSTGIWEYFYNSTEVAGKKRIYTYEFKGTLGEYTSINNDKFILKDE